MNRFIARPIFLSILIISWAFPITAAVIVTPRTDHVLSLQGSVSEKIKISFAEVFYLAANLLDPSCLLRYPNGQFGFSSESVIIDPVVQRDGSFKIEMPMNRYNGTDTCQFQFGFIKLWLTSSKPAPGEIGGYVVLAKSGSVVGGTTSGSASAIETISCKKALQDMPENQDLQCAFFNAQGQPIQVGAPSTGLNIKGLLLNLIQ